MNQPKSIVRMGGLIKSYNLNHVKYTKRQGTYVDFYFTGGYDRTMPLDIFYEFNSNQYDNDNKYFLDNDQRFLKIEDCFYVNKENIAYACCYGTHIHVVFSDGSNISVGSEDGKSTISEERIADLCDNLINVTDLMTFGSSKESNGGSRFDGDLWFFLREKYNSRNAMLIKENKKDQE